MHPYHYNLKNMDSVAEIKSKLQIEDVVAPYVNLKKSGKYLKACCPFHQEKTPSFVVSVERQMAYCFGCNKGGDIFQFIQDIEGVDFMGALEILADKAGVTLSKGNVGPKVSKDEKNALKIANREASNFFVQQLWGSSKAEKVLEYLRNRALTDELIKEFDIGFAPDEYDALYRFLLGKKLSKDVILESSLAIAGDSGSEKVFDRFRLRLMFPIQNVQGDYIAFGGRALKKGDNPKYLNSPEYVLYSKGETLFNLNRAKQYIRNEDFVVFVEGYFDVVASHKAGIRNVVATSGTALTDKQLRLIKRYTKNVVFAFDSDNAGREALLRAVKTAQELELDIFVVMIEKGKDASELVKMDADLWVNTVKNRLPYLEYYMNEFSKIHDLSSSGGKRAFTDSMFNLLSGVKHPVLLDHFIKEISKLVGTPVDMLYELLGSISSKEKRTHRKLDEEKAKVAVSKEHRLLSYFLGMLLSFPGVFFDVWKQMENFDVFLAGSSKLGLVKQLNNINESDLKSFHDGFEKFLSEMDFTFDASRVYKQVRDHYNLRGELDGGFYSGFEDSDLLHKIAIEAEVKNVDEKLVPEEFEKLILLLYLEFVTTKKING